MAEHNFPKNINITSLITADSSGEFEITWDYNPGNPDISFKIYRFIGEFPNDPTIDPIINNEDWVLISTVDKSLRTYTDSLNDLNLNGFTIKNGIWVDSNDNNVLEQIYKTRRKLYYKIIAINNVKLQFNSLPFIFIAYGEDLSCKSTITQVKFNNLYNEGEDIWYESSIAGSNYTINSIALDANFHDRQGLVWVTANNGSNGKVVVVDITTGGTNFKQEYTFNYPVYNIKVDPEQGDGIVAGKTSSLIRCRLSSGLTQNIGSTTKAVGTYGGYGVTLSKVNSQTLAQTIWDRHYVLDWNISTPGAATLVPTEYYGEVYSGQDNNFGITTGFDQEYFVNGHRRVTINWSVARTVYPPC